MAYQYGVPDSAVRYILLQRTEYFSSNIVSGVTQRLLPSLYSNLVQAEVKFRKNRIKDLYLRDMEQEYRSIKDALPESCRSILDVGCGVAGIDVFLNRHYAGNVESFYLLDKTQVESSVYYGYKEKGAFYNSLDVARQMLRENGIDDDKIHLLEATENNDIATAERFDLVCSLISWGFHYPVATYLERVHERLNDGGVLILDVRNGTTGLAELSDRFGGYDVVQETEKYIRARTTKAS